MIEDFGYVRCGGNLIRHGVPPRPRGTRIVAQALLAIPDAPPACFRHWRRQAPVPSTMSHIDRTWLDSQSLYKSKKNKTPHWWGLVLFGIRQRPTLPGRLQPSTIGAERLNFCVRYGNRWDPFAIVTGILLGFVQSAFRLGLRSVCS